MPSVRNHPYFNPRSPCGERRSTAAKSSRPVYFNPRSPCGERRGMIHPYGQPCPIFQSTLPMRGATFKVALTAHFVDISIHAPHAGSDYDYLIHDTDSCRFQSTLPMRGATGRFSSIWLDGLISIHAPHAGSDPICVGAIFGVMQFQSTLPMRGATMSTRRVGALLKFQSTLPMRGATCHILSELEHHSVFQSTLPMRGATQACVRT